MPPLSPPPLLSPHSIRPPSLLSPSPQGGIPPWLRITAIEQELVAGVDVVGPRFLSLISESLLLVPLLTYYGAFLPAYWLLPSAPY